MTEDRNISVADVQTLATRDDVAAFFAALGYGTDTRQPQSVSAMGITAGSLSRQIRHIERIAVHDDGAEPLDSYLVELTSVTVAATQGLARALRNRAGNYLLVLTDDYERLDFVLLQRSLPGTPTSPMSGRQVSVRPRILTVNRRNASPVQLRVLRRFTYTELEFFVFQSTQKSTVLLGGRFRSDRDQIDSYSHADTADPARRPGKAGKPRWPGPRLAPDFQCSTVRALPLSWQAGPRRVKPALPRSP